MPDGSPEAEQVRVALDLLVAELLADPLEVGVAGHGERAAQVDRPVARPHPAALRGSGTVVSGVITPSESPAIATTILNTEHGW